MSPSDVTAAAQVIAFVCVLVWLINYHHFLTWRWRGFKKLADPFFVPDPSTIHVDLGPMVSWLESVEKPVAPGFPCLGVGRLPQAAQFSIGKVDGFCDFALPPGMLTSYTTCRSCT